LASAQTLFTQELEPMGTPAQARPDHPLQPRSGWNPMHDVNVRIIISGIANDENTIPDVSLVRRDWAPSSGEFFCFSPAQKFAVRSKLFQLSSAEILLQTSKRLHFQEHDSIVAN
jgi:hypothetical protein